MGSGMGGVLRIIDCDGNPNLLGVNANDAELWLNAYYDNPDNVWNVDNGFAFVVSQISLFLSLIGEFFLLNKNWNLVL
jgi:hypothetical protein